MALYGEPSKFHEIRKSEETERFLSLKRNIGDIAFR